MQSAKIIIIGGGAIGLSTACHLGLRGESDVLLLERHELTSGTSWHAAGIIGPLRASLAATRLAMYAPTFFRELEQQTGQATGYQQTGGLWLAQTADRDSEIRRIAALGNSLGFGTHLLSGAEIQNEHSWINNEGLHSALWVDEDGQANPVDVCMAYAKAARQAGVTIQSGQGVTRIEQLSNGYQLTLENGQGLCCETLIVCAGLWSAALLKPLNIHLPLMPVEHMYVVTEPIAGLPNPVPITRDLDAGLYCKGDAGKLVLGGFEREAKTLDACAASLQQPYAVFDEDWEQFEPFMLDGIKRFPALGESGIRQFLNGPESFTADTQPLLGPVPGKPGLFVAAGMNSLGIVSSPGVGKALTEWVLDGLPEWDLLAQDVARFDLKQNTTFYLQQRMREAVASQFETHWPYKQTEFGRGAKRTPVHHLMQQQRAVFGSFAGWERPLWFAQNDRESRIEYSYGEQSWWPIIRRETLALENGCGLVDLSPFCKFHVCGDGALAYMQNLTTRDMDLPLGKACYCLILNHQGGIMADVTVTRLADEHFLVIAAAGCRYRLWDWMREREIHPVPPLPKEGILQQDGVLAGKSARHQVYKTKYEDLEGGICQQPSTFTGGPPPLQKGERGGFSFTDETTQEAVFGIMGKKSRALLQSLSNHDFSNDAFPFGSVQNVELGFVRLRIARLSYVGGLGYELYCPNEYAAYLYEQLKAAGENFDLQPVGLLCVDACRMEQGFVHWGHDIGPNDDPVSAELMFAVNEDKVKAGAFIGAEAVQQLLADGTEYQRVLLEVLYEDETPLLLHDEPVYCAETVVGHTTSGVVGGRSGDVLVMAYIQRTALNGDGELMVDVGGRRCRLQKRN
ncbi:MAG: FAD-dependent oxidoreductase [Thiolinea sp.]